MKLFSPRHCSLCHRKFRRGQRFRYAHFAIYGNLKGDPPVYFCTVRARAHRRCVQQFEKKSTIEETAS